jgi:hypothetical protein
MSAAARNPVSWLKGVRGRTYGEYGERGCIRIVVGECAVQHFKVSLLTAGGAGWR